MLAADLRHELPGLVLIPGNPSPSGDVRSVVVNVRHFAAENSARVVLLADWSLIAGRPPSAILTRSEAISLSIHSSRGSDVVPVMSKAIALLSERIANTIYSAGQVTARR